MTASIAATIGGAAVLDSPHVGPLSSEGTKSDGDDNSTPYDRDASAIMSKVLRIYRMEAIRCAVMIVAFGIALVHLYVYEQIGTDVAPVHSIPAEELRFFHYGWTAMLTIFLVDFFAMSLKVWCTWHSPVLALAIAQKFEGSIGVLFGEYIVVGATYVIMGFNWMPVFLESRTERRVYGVRYMEWAVDACGLVFLDCHILFSQPWKKFYMAFIWSVAYVMFGLWSAIAPTWPLYWVLLAASWITFSIVCFMLIHFLQTDPRLAYPFKEGVKPCILGFIITWWVLYGVLFMVEFGDKVPQWTAQFLWTGMDVIMKLSHTVVIMAWRAAQWDIDATVKRHKAEAQRFIAQLDRERALTEKERFRLLTRIHSKHSNKLQGVSDIVPGERHVVSMDDLIDNTADSQGNVSCEPAFNMEEEKPDLRNSAPSLSRTLTLSSAGIGTDAYECWRQVIAIYKREAVKCCILCGAFILSLIHLYIYPEVFGVTVLPEQEVPQHEMYVFHGGWTSMLVIFLIEAITFVLKVWGTSKEPHVARTQAEKFQGNIGVLFAEYLVVCVTYAIMGYNLMPVFVEPRTGRRVYAVRYMEWMVDACGLVSLDCHCLFNRSEAESRMAFVWTVAYILFGLWSALASTWAWYWALLVLSWLTFAFTCGMLVHFLWQDPYPLEPFGRKPVKMCILAFIITWWTLYGVVFMVAFQAPDIMPQYMEQCLWTTMDVIMKLSHTGVLIAWRETQWDMDTVVSMRRMNHEKRTSLEETKQIQEEGEEERHVHVAAHPSLQNWTSTPGLEVGVSDIMRLQGMVGPALLSDGKLRSMMSAEEYCEFQRLETLGLSHAQLQASWEWQIREQHFLKKGILNVNYDPECWAKTLLGFHGRAGISYPTCIVVAVALALAALREQMPEIAESLSMSDSIHSLVSGSVMFLVVFRVQYAFRKWWDGRAAFGKIVLYSRTLGQMVCAYIWDDELCQRAVKYLITSVVAARCHLRNENIDSRMLLGIISDAEVEEVNKQSNMPYYATWVIRSCIASAVASGKFFPLQVPMDNALRALEEAIGDAERLLTPMPFIYVAHLRSFLFLYLLFLPFVLVEKLGRAMVLAVALASYLLIGLEHTAVTLENPFGYQSNDLPLDLYCIEASRDLLGVLELREKNKARVSNAEKESVHTEKPAQTAHACWEDAAGADDGD